jgi:D-xylose 1-dehydrogenase (NADP+, D-xylono-1,5-lactone-forming)
MTIKWGFLGASWVASTALVPAVADAKNASLYAVASRDPERSQKLNPAKVYASYEDLISDPDVDAVYISLANHLHLEWASKALSAGKHVLCEKPLATSYAEAKLMADSAVANDKLLVEAVWTRWHPRFARVVELVRNGDIGVLQNIDSAFTFTTTFTENYRLDPEMGGGSLLDVGPYQAHVWSALAPKNSELRIDSASANIGPTGIDLTTQVNATLSDSISISALTSFEQEEKQSLVITGSNAKIEFPQGQAFTSWKEASSIQIGDHVENFAPVDPFTLMIEAVGNRIQGEPVWLPSLRESLWVMDALDKIKAFSR